MNEPKNEQVVLRETVLLDCARITREYGVSRRAAERPLSPSRALELSYGEPGHSVYVLDCDHGVKIGITASVAGRLRDIERGSGFRPVLFKTWRLGSRDEAGQVERGAHWLLRESRTTGEWFHCHPIEAADAVERCIRYGPPLGASLTGEEAENVRAALARRAA